MLEPLLEPLIVTLLALLILPTIPPALPSPDKIAITEELFEEVPLIISVLPVALKQPTNPPAYVVEADPIEPVEDVVFCNSAFSFA